MVEYIGIQNLINVVKNSLGVGDGKVLFEAEGMKYWSLSNLSF